MEIPYMFETFAVMIYVCFWVTDMPLFSNQPVGILADKIGPRLASFCL